MSTYTPAVTLRAVPYRGLILTSALVMVIHMLVGGSHALIDRGFLVTLLADAFVIVCSLVAWLHQDSGADARRILLLALGLLVPQVVLDLVGAWSGAGPLVLLANPGISAFILAALLSAAVASSVPNAQQAQRIGGRAMRRARQYTRLIGVGAAASWLLLLVAAAPSSTEPLVQRAYPVLLTVAGLLTLVAAWQTWHTRRHDRLLMSTAGAAIGFLLALVTNEVITWATVPPQLSVLLATGLWSSLIVMGTLSLRRPVPAVAPAEDTRQRSEEKAASEPSLLKDYISLTKPKVISLLLVTTLAAMFITGEGLPSLVLVFWTMLGGYLAAGGAGAINCAFDKNIDVNMGRTSRRPVPSGRISPRNAFLFGLTLSILSFVVMYVFTTPLAALLSTVGIVYYAVFYTRWLKPNTWQNIVIGGGAGALPPLVGWAAVTGSLNLPALVLFMIVFYWTPPHFWALALVKEKDYARAGVPMLPVVAGEADTGWQIWLYSLLLVGISLLLTPIQAMGFIYLVLAAVLGLIFLRYAWNVWRSGGQAHIWGLYKYSLLYLALLFGAMVLDRMILL